VLERERERERERREEREERGESERGEREREEKEREREREREREMCLWGKRALCTTVSSRSCATFSRNSCLLRRSSSISYTSSSSLSTYKQRHKIVGCNLLNCGKQRNQQQKMSSSHWPGDLSLATHTFADSIAPHLTHSNIHQHLPERPLITIARYKQTMQQLGFGLAAYAPRCRRR